MKSALFFVLALAVMGSWCNPKHTSPEEPLAFRAPDLMSEYLRDTAAADKKYKGKQMLISGVVSQANAGDNTVSLRGANSPIYNFVKCHLTPAESAKIGSVVENQGIVIQGQNDGWDSAYLQISHCVIKGQ